jgi:predicted Rossmann fold nucleotide-binding protein DprA/Smf involved in DNA uptake
MFVSGLAVGIDSVSHQCSVDRSVPTIVVTACGIDYVYPKKNANLRGQILQQGGLILTEQFPNDYPHPAHFNNRNRILANLSTATFVAEAGANSGALITANYAYRNGKTVFALPPNDVYNKAFEGQIDCIRNGAVCTFGYEDILYEYVGEYPLKVRRTDIIDFRSGKAITDSPIFKNVKGESVEEHNVKPEEDYTSATTTSTYNSNETSTTDTPTPIATTKVEPLPKPKEVESVQVPLDKNQALVVESIRNGCTCLDDIARVTSIEIPDLLEITTGLEIDGIIKSGFGNVYTLV